MPRIMEPTLEAEAVAVDPATLEAQVRLILTAIEGETVPDRLLELAIALQSALAQQKQKLSAH